MATSSATIAIEFPWCGATTEASLLDGEAIVYRCEREVGHGGTVRAGGQMQPNTYGYCQWPIATGEQPYALSVTTPNSR